MYRESKMEVEALGFIRQKYSEHTAAFLTQIYISCIQNT